MTVTIPLVLLVGVAAFICYRYMGLRLWHLILCIILGFLIAATSFAPEIQNMINAVIHGGHK